MARVSPQPQIIQRSWSRGQRRAISRDQLGANAAWLIEDYIIDRLGAPLTKRGGWQYAGSSFAGGTILSLCDGPQNGGHRIVAVDDSGVVWRATNSPNSPPSTWAVDAFTANVGVLKQNPYFYLDTIVFPSPDGSAGLHQANENSVSTYPECGITHKPTILTSWKNRMVGASGEFLVFGPPIGVTGTLSGNPWDEDGTYGVSQPIVGLHPMRGALLIWYNGYMERVRGTTPAGYGVSEDDILFEDLFSGIGCVDAYSITEWNDFVVWVDRKGVYLTDGAAPVDLTQQGDMKDEFSSFMTDYTADWRVASGIFDDILFVSITDLVSEEHIRTFVCDLPRRIWSEAANTPFTTFMANKKDVNQTHVGLVGIDGRVGHLSTILDPSDDTRNDGNGVAVSPKLQLGYGRYSAGPMRLVDLYVGYEFDGESHYTPPSSDDLAIEETSPGVFEFTWSGAWANTDLVDPGVFATFSSGVTLNFTTQGGGGFDEVDELDVTGLVGPTFQLFLDGQGPATLAAAATADEILDAMIALSNVAGTASVTESLGSIEVSYTKQPTVDPTYSNFGDGEEILDAKDIHSVEDPGNYRYRRVPVRDEGPGLSVQIEQTGQSADTRIYNISGTLIPLSGQAVI